MSTFEESLEKLKAREQQAREKAHAEGRRPLSAVKRRMIESSVKVAATLPDEILFQHSVSCQTVLPYRDPGPNIRVWEREQGRVSLSLEAGRAKDPQGQYVPVGLPYGSAARLMLCHLNTAALKTQRRAIEIEGSMTAYIRHLTGHLTRGADIRRFKDQLIRLSACIIRLNFDAGPAALQINTQIVAGFDL